jgi:hypothetical protein
MLVANRENRLFESPAFDFGEESCELFFCRQRKVPVGSWRAKAASRLDLNKSTSRRAFGYGSQPFQGGNFLLAREFVEPLPAVYNTGPRPA